MAESHIPIRCGRPWLVQAWTTLQHGDILFSMYEFNKVEEEPEPQASGSRFGPPRKHTGAGLLDPAQYPPIRPRCFGCSQPLMVAEISRHILSCDKVSAQDLARFKTALAEFKACAIGHTLDFSLRLNSSAYRQSIVVDAFQYVSDISGLDNHSGVVRLKTILSANIFLDPVLSGS